MGYLIAILLFFSVPAFAKCENEVTIDQRYTQLRQQKVSGEIDEVEYEVGVTGLLNEAFTPYLVYLNNIIQRVERNEIEEMGQVYSDEISTANHRSDPLVHSANSDFNAAFIGFRKVFLTGRPRSVMAPYTEFNSTEMHRLLVAVKVMMFFEDKYARPEEIRSIDESRRLRDQTTFSRDSIATQMYFAYLSTLQSAAGLTADPIEGWTADEMVRDVMSRGKDCIGMVALHSLMAPPRLIGANGTYFYRANPVEVNDGRLTMTKDFRGFLRKQKAEFAANYIKKDYEHMKGCPVAHSTNGLSQPCQGPRSHGRPCR
jgi:hypothetical protein